MEFINMKDSSSECILGATVKMTGKGCSIEWNYPIKYTTVCIFPLGLSEEFDERKAASGNYKSYTMKYPDQQLSINSVANFAVFPVNESGQLIRQKTGLHTCNITVDYGFSTEVSEVRGKGIKKLFAKPDVKKRFFLNIKAPIALPGRTILYRLKNKNGVFCIPSDLIAGRVHKFEISGKIELFTKEKYISLKNLT